GGVGRRLVALRAPYRLGQALDRLVHRLVPATRTGKQRSEALDDSRRLVDRQLLLESHVQAHVQEWVRFIGIVLPAVALRSAQHLVILGMREDRLERQRLDAGKRLAGAILAPGVEERVAHLLARGVKHPWSSCGTRTGRGSGIADSRACARGTRSGRAGSASDA